MLKNMDSSLDVIKTLLDSTFVFYLTGSRFFKTNHSTSDWDFFITDSPEVRSLLVFNGFRNICPITSASLMKCYPEDPNICDVYGAGMVQIQLVKDADQKQRAQEFLNTMPTRLRSLFNEDSKNKEAQDWWRWAYSTTLRPVQRCFDDCEEMMLGKLPASTIYKFED